MKQANTRKIMGRMIVSLIACAVLVGIGTASGTFESLNGAFEGIRLNFTSLLQLAVMTAAVLVAENAVLLLCSILKPKSNRGQTFLSIFCNALRYISAIVGLCWGLSILGADVKTVVASLGVLALIIGFGANSLIADLVTGLFLVFENQYNVGDYVEVDGFRGRVSSIGIRTTCLEDAGGNIKIINNSDMSNILNRSNHTSRAVSTIGIPYQTDLEKLEQKFPAMMAQIHSRHSDILIAQPEYLGVEELGDSAIILKFAVEVADENIFRATRVLNRELFLCFRAVGVEVPCTQLDVHSL